jgi:hypothetical protein
VPSVIDPANLLSAASAPAATSDQSEPSDSSWRHARLLVAGATGRLGEALLNESLARAGFAEVAALAEPGAEMTFGVRGLSLASLADLPPLDAVLIAQGDSTDAAARSFHGRDAPFVQVDTADIARIARAAAAAGARRLVLIHPLPAWQQMSGLHRGLVGEAELLLAQLPFESVCILRPLATAGPLAGSWLQRVVGAYLSLQMLMVPRSLPTLTSQQIARAAVGCLRRARPGVSTLGAADLLAALDPPAER